MEHFISICIPVYEMHGFGVKMLKQCLDSVAKQTYKNFEVVISDHSKDNIIFDFINTYEIKDKIKYYKFAEKYNNGPANTNNCLRQAKGEYIKILFQDDFFFDEKSLFMFNDNIKDNNWVVSSCLHTDERGEKKDRKYVPHWFKQIGINNYMSRIPPLGCPSLHLFKNGYNIFFDENLVHLMDVEFFYQLGNLTTPIILNGTLLVIRNWSYNISHQRKDVCQNKEKEYIKNKHK